MGAPRGSIESRFWRFVVPSDGCWEWRGSRLKKGYGRIRLKLHGKSHELAHRVAWEIHNGPVPDGLWVLHHCDNPACVNPAHLFVGTNSDNVCDMFAKMFARNGRMHWSRALSADRAKDILDWLGDGIPLHTVAKAFGWNPGALGRWLNSGRLLQVAGVR